MKKTIIGLIAIISCLLCGCGGEPECPLNYVSLARFNFVDSKTHATVKLTNGPTITGTIGVNGAAQTDTVFNQAESYMSVPLSYTNQTAYVIHYTETMRDTIVLKHKNIPFVSDIECPALMFYEVEGMTYTTNALDSVKLVNARITYEEAINFHIYYRATGAE